MKLKERIKYLVRATAIIISPKFAQKLIYRVKFKRKLNLKNPQTLNEKNLWLMNNTYKNNSLVKQCADKYGARKYLEKLGLGEILVPVYGIFDSPDEINWSELPNSFVIKVSSGCGYNIIVKEKQSFNFTDVKKRLKRMISKSKYIYLDHGEMQYKGVKPKIIIEKLLTEGDLCLPIDYKIFCMNGNVVATEVCIERDINGKNARFFFMSPDWKLLKYTKDSLNVSNDFVVPKPKNLESLYKYARAISKAFPFVRVDLYLIDGKCYFGEMTFTPSGAFNTTYNVIVPDTNGLTADYLLGQSLNIYN